MSDAERCRVRRSCRPRSLAALKGTAVRTDPAAASGPIQSRFASIAVHPPAPADRADPVVVRGRVGLPLRGGSGDIVARQAEGSEPPASKEAPPVGPRPVESEPKPGGSLEAGEETPTPVDEPAPGAAPAAPTAAPPAPVCQPKGLDRADFFAAGGSTKEFGLTRLDTSAVTYPEVTTVKAGRGVKLQPTTAALPTIPSIFMQAGSFVEGTVMVFGEPDRCPTRKYPMRWLITADGAKRIAAGEQEHCDDFQQAFALSIGTYAAAVNRIAGSGRTFASEKQAERAVTKAAGAAPADWPDIFRCLARRSVTARDGATKISPRSWHEPRPRTMPPRFPGCEEARAIVSGASLPEVGAHPSADVIHGCGEAPAPKGKKR